MKRKQLRKDEIKKLNEGVGKFGFEISKKDSVEVIDDRIISVNNEPLFFLHDGKPAPLLKKIKSIKTATVDMGAVKFVASGADVMRPGIAKTDEFESGEIIAVVDEINSKPLAVGKALFSSDQMMKMQKGKVIQIIHFVGDELWKS